MKKIVTLAVLLVIICCSQSFAAPPVSYDGAQIFSIAWTSNGSGTATVGIDIRGIILHVWTEPGAATPLDNYDVAYNFTGIGGNTWDAFKGGGANRSNSAMEDFIPFCADQDGVSSFLCSTPCGSGASSFGAGVITVTNAGASKTGYVYIAVKPRK